MSRRSSVEVLRYRPEQDKEPFFQTYTVPCEEEWVVLDALNYVKDEIDRTLSYRWSCHMFVCGSCGQDRRRAEARLQGVPARLQGQIRESGSTIFRSSATSSSS